ncbi:hypothetical protein EMCRGX_G023591 [Ephydatia muelleri]
MAEGEQVTAISGATLEKAVSELHEDPSTRLQYIDDLRKLVENDEEAEDSVDHSVRRNDSKFLLRFLRAKKFDVDRARALYSNYYTFRAKHADILGTLEPRALDHVYRCGIVSLLEHKDKTGCAVMCFKPSLWPMDQYPLTDLVRGLLMLLERLIEDEENQVHGLRFVYNFDGVSLYQMFTVARSDLARNGIMVELFQEAFPGRFKGLHFINQPWYISIPLSLLLPFFKEKFRERIRLHGVDYASLSQYIDLQYVPSDFGGEGPPSSCKSICTLMGLELN